MWFDDLDPDDRWTPAIEHLKADPALAWCIERAGPCTLRPKRGGGDVYTYLVKSIFNQQLSIKGATTLYNRFVADFPRKKPTPDLVLPALTGGWTDEHVKHCGLSRQKRAYLIDLSEKVLAGDVKLTGLGKLTDAEVIERLTRVKGVGEWTAQMILMFCLCRPDVLPTADLGLWEALKIADGLDERPTPKQLEARAEPWRPYRTVASWYLWRGAKGD